MCISSAPAPLRRCPPCQRFTPKLAETYKKLQAAGAKLEIVFVSSDRDKEAFDHYFATQPWLALPFDARDAKGKLSAMFDVAGIPTLILLGPDLKVVNADARAAVDAGRDFPWVRFYSFEHHLPSPVVMIGHKARVAETLC